MTYRGRRPNSSYTLAAPPLAAGLSAPAAVDMKRRAESARLNGDTGAAFEILNDALRMQELGAKLGIRLAKNYLTGEQREQ